MTRHVTRSARLILRMLPYSGPVRVLQNMPERWRNLISDAMKFGLVGAVNTVIDFVVFNLLLQIGSLKANVVSTVVATTTSYGMNRHWTFRDRPRGTVRREYLLFFAFNLVGMLIQLGVLGLVKYGFGFDEHRDRLLLNVAKAGGIGVAMIFRFWAYRTFVFIPRPVQAAQDASGTAQPVEVAAMAAPLDADAMAAMAADTAAVVGATAAPAGPGDEVTLTGGTAADEARLDALDEDLELDRMAASVEAELDAVDIDPGIGARSRA